MRAGTKPASTSASTLDCDSRLSRSISADQMKQRTNLFSVIIIFSVDLLRSYAELERKANTWVCVFSPFDHGGRMYVELVRCFT